jgi:hypothetical protein
MKPIDRLKSLHRDETKRTHPNIPDYAIPAYKRSDKDTNGLTACVIDFLIYSGHHAERTGNEGRTVDDTKIVTDYLGRTKKIGSVKRIPSQGTIGTSDLKACINGRFIAIEIKFGKDRQSDAQKSYEEKITNAGGVYIIVRNFGDFLEWYDKFIIN